MSSLVMPWRYPDGPVPIGPPRDRPADAPLPVVDAEDVRSDLSLWAEVVVIGSGAGGAVVAAELAERGVDVIVLEQGRRFSREDFHHPPLEAYLEMYHGGGITATLGTPGIALPYGRAIGGTTIMNSGTCFRLPPRVYEQWSREQLGMPDQRELDRYYDRVEKRIHVTRVPAEIAGKNANVVERGAKKLGVSGGYLLRNAKSCVGSGRCAFGCPSGAKQSTERSYLPDAAAHGARIFARAEVRKILIEQGRAVGVVAHTLPGKGRPSRTIRVRAERVVLAGGSINTPILLQANGLGGREVGRNLHIHPAAKLIALMGEPVGGQGVPQSYYVDQLHDQGVMLEGAYVPPEFGSVAVPYFGERHRLLMEASSHLATFGVMVTDTSHGRVRRGLGGTALIRYDLNQTDTERFKKGLALCARIFLAAGARKVYTALPMLEEVESEADVARIERAPIRPADLELIAFHPLGTCRAGRDAKASVVTPDLDVHGVRNLMVVDGSVVPSSIGVNPQLTIMALATRAAEYIASTLRR